MSRFRDVLSGYAAEIRDSAAGPKDALVITPERRDSLYARLEQAGLRLDRGTYELAAPFIQEQLTAELTRAYFDSETVVRRRAQRDRQLQAALLVLRGAGSQDEALTAAMRVQLSGRVR